MQGIVIQGPTAYWDQIIEVYKDVPNVVWSTWDDEPIENIKNIEQYIPVITSPKPSFPGYLNINMQTVSTFKGAEYLESKGVTEILKTRGDIRIKNLNKLMECLKGKEMALLATCKNGVRTDIYYELVYSHYSHDYPTDQVIYGSTLNIKNTFNFQIEEVLPIPPESLIAYSFLTSKGEDFLLDYDYLKNKNVYFYMNDCIENDIELFIVKEKFKCDLVEMHNNKQYYEF
jgi:hypothetical protein